MANRRLTTRRQRLWQGIAAAAVIAGVAATVLALMLAANTVDPSVTAGDRKVIAKLGVEGSCEKLKTYDDEMRCIRAVQRAVRERYPSTKDAFIKGHSDHDVGAYDIRGFGSCYDRATLIEKSLRYFGMESRRVALYKAQPKIWGYLKPGIPSHALSEAKTARGWLVVDSIDPLVAIDDRGQPMNIAQVRAGLLAGEIDDHSFGVAISDEFFDGHFAYIYGVHSRHGYFFEPYLPVPEVNWSHFGF